MIEHNPTSAIDAWYSLAIDRNDGASKVSFHFNTKSNMKVFLRMTKSLKSEPKVTRNYNKITIVL